jgi:hypothetical protein
LSLQQANHFPFLSQLSSQNLHKSQ